MACFEQQLSGTTQFPAFQCTTVIPQPPRPKKTLTWSILAFLPEIDVILLLAVGPKKEDHG